jgi:3-oxoadipate enol-lactonase / 4-carboxymuconolactone decarboxylase
MEGNVEIPGGYLRYRVDGADDAPPVLLINSLGSSLDLWAAQAEAWSQTLRVVRYDMRGHGQSSSPPGEYTIDDLGQDAIRVLDALGIASAHICGISIGGLTAMWLGIHHPSRAKTLVIANTAARVGTPQRWIDRIAKVRNEGMSAVADAAMTAWFTPAFREREPAVVARFHRMVASTDPAGYISCCAVLRDADLRADLPRITTHALVVAGAHDTTTTGEDADFIYAQLKSAAEVTLPGAHMTNVECAEAFSHHAGSLFALVNAGIQHAAGARKADRAAGDTMRRQVLGNAHVDRARANASPMSSEFQDFITRYVWGEIWTRPGLDQRTRRVLVIGTTIALGRWEEFTLHVRAAVEQGGFTADDIKEIVLQQAAYCGVPAANHALKLADEILRGDGVA